MSKPSKAQQIIDFSKTSIFSIGEINQIAQFMDGDIEATLKIARTCGVHRVFQCTN